MNIDIIFMNFILIIVKVRLKEGKTAKITDIPGFLTQCMQSKVNTHFPDNNLIITDIMVIVIITIVITEVVIMARCGRTQTL